MAFVITSFCPAGAAISNCSSFIHVAMMLFGADAVFDVEFFRHAWSGIAEGLVAGLNGKFIVLDGSRDRRRDVRSVRGQNRRGEKREDDCKGERAATK